MREEPLKLLVCTGFRSGGEYPSWRILEELVNCVVKKVFDDDQTSGICQDRSMDTINDIFELLAVSPLEANNKALVLLNSAISQEEMDSINWARAYALVELKQFNMAIEIWQDVYDRTQNHRALHQVGFVHRSAGNFSEALNFFSIEKSLIIPDDIQAVAINLYELTYCHFLLNNITQAYSFFREYENLKMEESDLVERGCFFRLKGDIYKSGDKVIAQEAYILSLEFFEKAKDDVSAGEVRTRLFEL
jgi:tetratricopeptide (TPR) repeat protein